MALVIGDRTASSGLTKRLYDNLLVELGSIAPGYDQTTMKKSFYALSKSVVDEINDNLVITGTGPVDGYIIVQKNNTLGMSPVIIDQYGHISGGGGGVITKEDITGLKLTDSPQFTGLNLSGLTASALIVTDASKNIASLTSPSLTEIGYLIGVTSGIQAQLNSKTSWPAGGTSSNFLRGDITWNVPTKNDIGLGNVGNYAQVRKISSSINNDIMLWADTNGDNPKDSGVTISTDNTLGGVTPVDIKVPTEKAVKNYVDGVIPVNYWDKTITTLSPHTAGDDISFGTGGMKDTNVITAIKLGDGSNTSFSTTNKTIVGSVNELYNNKQNTLTIGNFSATSPINQSGGTGAVIGAGISLTIDNAKADGSTKGAACFNSSDFNDNGSGLISIDYSNGQMASMYQNGFLSAADWIIFNSKGSSITTGNLSATSPLNQTGGTGSIIGVGVSLTIDDASISGKGVVQLSNFYSGTSQSLATTEKALSDGLATKQSTLILGNLSVSSPLSVDNTRQIIGGSLAISIADAKADSSTKGVSSFNITDFNDNESGLISIDYENGQLANMYQNGFLSLEDWINFNSKQNNLAGSILGTSAQINVTENSNSVAQNIILSLPQSIDVTSSPTFANLIDNGLTINTALTTNGSKQLTSSSTTDIELSYVHGVTSDIQTQINGKSADNAVVHNSGDETIAGIKTFSSFPITPSSAPSSDYQVANKKFVIDNSGTNVTGLDILATEISSDAIIATNSISFGKIKINNGVLVKIQNGIIWKIYEPISIIINDPWHYVGGTGEPIFENSWVNYGDPFRTACFFKDGNKVEIRGMVKSGTLTLGAFTLPVGYRPSKSEYLSTNSNGAYGSILINPTGAVIPYDGLAAAFTLNCYFYIN